MNAEILIIISCMYQRFYCTKIVVVTLLLLLLILLFNIPVPYFFTRVYQEFMYVTTVHSRCNATNQTAMQIIMQHSNYIY